MLIEAKKDTTDISKNEPIFILEISNKSGTNFVSDLLSLHPECDNSLITEDFFMAHADFKKSLRQLKQKTAIFFANRNSFFDKDKP